MEKTIRLTVGQAEQLNLPEIMEIQDQETNPRLDAYIATTTDMSRSAAVRMIEQGRVLCNGKACPKNSRLKDGDIIDIYFPEPVPSSARPENIPLDIVYEDEDLIVVNKPSGMVVHPAPGNETGTLVNALLFHCGQSLSGIGGVIRPGIVHRIDKDTSGLLVVAKNDDAHLGLAAQLKGHHINRIYEAISIGSIRDDVGVVNAPIGRHPTDRKKMAVIRDGLHSAREAITHYTVLERLAGMTYVRCELETGRTHQIRVHLASLGHPILGDPLYGGANHPFCNKHKEWIDGQCLHAKQLSFVHPRTGQKMHFECPLPEKYNKVLQILRDMAND